MASSTPDGRMSPAQTRRTSVTFVGFEAFWMGVLVDGLSSRHGDVLDCRWVVWPSTWSERLRFVFAMLRSDVVVRVGMPFEFVSETNRLWIDWILRSRKVRGVNYWIGYDVRSFKERLERQGLGPADLRAIRGLTHWSGAPNMTETLVELGVSVETVVFPSPSRPVPDPIPPFPTQFRALLYWADGRWEYSGGPMLVEAARRLPDIGFDVVGATGTDVSDPPPNMRFHGRVSDIDRFYADSIVLVREVEWDAVPSGMVEEALVFGRYVIYSFAFPHTVHVPKGDVEGLVSALSRLRDAHGRGELPPNVEGRTSIVETWVPDTRWLALCRRIRDLHVGKAHG